MSLVVELIADLEQGGFTARLPDIPAYGEGETEDEAIADLKEALRGYIETFGLEDARSRLSSPSIRTIELELTELARG
jgi:predicted RNase H-like HicB family nuclease